MENFIQSSSLACEEELLRLARKAYKNSGCLDQAIDYSNLIAYQSSKVERLKKQEINTFNQSLNSTS